MVKLRRTYPIWLYLLHLSDHGGMGVYQLIGFASSFHSSDDNIHTSEFIGPGWRFRYVNNMDSSHACSVHVYSFLIRSDSSSERCE